MESEASIIGKEAIKNGKKTPTDEDRYPTLNRLLRAVLEDADDVNCAVRQVHVRAGAGGDISYRIFVGRSEEPEQGHISPEQ